MLLYSNVFYDYKLISVLELIILILYIKEE